MSQKQLLTFVVITLFGGCVFNCDDYLRREIAPMDIRGIVQKKQNGQRGCFGFILVQDRMKIDTLDICFCVPENEKVWSYVLPNDSLYKEKGSLKIQVVRNGQERSFDYPCCAQ
jgi:hypothetical protein